MHEIHAAPSVFNEPFGVTVLEAKLAGIPSVVFPSGGLMETVSDGVDGYVCKGKNADALYDGLSYYLNDPRLAHRHGEAARASLERFSRETIGLEWVRFLQEEYRL